MSHEIFTKIPLIASEIKPIQKNQTVKAGQSSYKARSAVDVFNAVSSIMSKHGVFNTFEVLNNERENITNKYGTEGVRSVTHFRFHFHATDGSSVSIDQIGEAIDWGGDKCSNKCLTIAHRNALVSIFTIPFDGMDDPEETNHQDAEPRSTKQNNRSTEEKIENLDNYVLQNGKNKGQKLSDIPSDKLIQWVQYMEKNGFTKGQDYQMAKKYVDAVPSAPSIDEDEELPF